MKELHVHEITGHSLVPAKDIPALLDENHIEFQAIDCVNWNSSSSFPKTRKKISIITLNATVEVPCSSVVEDRATDLMHQWKSPEK